MKIKVTEERDCCETQDLVRYNGTVPSIPLALNPKFCKHCGQLWILESYMDASGDNDTRRIRYVPIATRAAQ